MHFLYKIISLLIIILSPIVIIFRIFSGKEDLKRFKEKFCFFSKKSKNVKTVWFHGSSVGEILSIIPIIKKFEKNKKIKQILITSSTTSSSLVLSKYQFKKTVHQFFPLDFNYLTNKFIKYWKPHIAIFVESEIWPNMYFNLKKNNIPIILINARLTKKSFTRWSYFPEFSKKVFNKISLAMPQNFETLKYLKLLSVQNLINSGNLKYYGERISKQISPLLKKRFFNKEIWCAASTHNHEELIIGKIHKKIKLIKKNLLTIIIPRHIDRKESIINDLYKIGLKVVTHSSNEIVKSDTDIYLVDTYGEALKFYSLSKVVFIGGSLIPHGGQNPLEPARLGNYIIHGPYINNFKEIYSLLNNLKLSSKVSKSSQIQSLLLNKINYNQTTSKNKKLYSIGKKILNKNLNEINKYI